MNHLSLIRIISLLSVFGVLGLSNPVLAQEDQEEVQDVLEEVIVTATKRETRLIDIPLAVQAFSGAQIDRANVREMSELFHYIPGASEGRTTNMNARSYQIRGVAAYYGDSTVGYYLDEAAYSVPNRNWAPVVPTIDLERAEVLRGPQGTLYGLSSMGGTIRFITRDPDLEEAQFDAQVGWSDTDGGDSNYNADLAFGVPIVKDKLAARFVGSITERGGFASSPTFPNDLDEDKTTNYRVKLLAKPNEDWTIKLGYQYVKGQDDYGKQYLTVNPPAFPPSTLLGEPYRAVNEVEYDYWTLYLAYAAEDWTFESSTGYVDREGFGTIPLPLFPGFYPRLDVGGPVESFTQEFRLVSASDSPFQWIAGGVIQDGKNTETVNLVGPAPPLPPGAPPLPPGTLFNFRDGVSTYDSSSWAVFGEVSYAWMDGRLVGLVGARYFEDDRKFNDTNKPPGPIFPPGIPAPPSPPPSIYNDEATFDSVNPRFNLSYRPDAGTNYYINIAKGFRSGTFNTQAGADATPIAGLTVDPDELWSYEVGGKWVFRNALSLELALYYIDWTDAQMNFSAPGQIQVIANAADIDGVGIDYLLNWAVTDRLTFSLSGNFNDTEYDKVLDPIAFQGTSVIEGNQVDNVPEKTFTGSVSYVSPIGSDMTLDLFAGYTYIDEQGDPTNTFKGESQELLRARAGVRWQNWGIYLVGTNLLNDDGPIQISGSGSTMNYPRTVGIELAFGY